MTELETDENLFGTVLRTAREGRGLSQAQLATLIRQTQHSISMWETGARTPARESVLALEDALGASGVFCGILGYRSEREPVTTMKIADAIAVAPDLDPYEREALKVFLRHLVETRDLRKPKPRRAGRPRNGSSSR